MKNRNELKNQSIYDFCDLCDIMTILRSEDGCPWDREQTHQSIRSNFIEEVYEAVEGIDKNDPVIMREELGDVLLQVVFHSQIASENGTFDISGVITDICKKLIIRHPHIFANVKAETSDEVLDNWNEIKKSEKGQKTLKETVSSISPALPSLMRAEKISKKLRRANVEQSEYDDVLSLISSFVASNDGGKRTVGKLLYGICKYASENDINCEKALFDECESIIESIE